VDLGGRVLVDGSAAAALDDSIVVSAIAPILLDGHGIGALQGGRVLGAAELERMKRATGLDLVLRDGAGGVRASTLAEPPAEPLPPASVPSRLSFSGGAYLARTVAVDVGDDPRTAGAVPIAATITGFVSTAPADEAVAALRRTVLAVGGVGVLLAVLLGWIGSAQIARPVERLAAFSREVAQGNWERPLEVRTARELDVLVEALERMRLDLRDYRARLVAGERQEAWSRLARRVAHEIKNPLTPIAVSIEDLRRSHAQGRADFPEILDQAVRTIAEEIATMRRLLQELTEFERLPAPRNEAVRPSGLLADLETLYRRDVKEGRLRIDLPNPKEEFVADPGQVRQALVNLVKNALEAIPADGKASVTVRFEPDAVEFVVEDDGPGLSEEQRAHLFAPGFTTKPEGSGLGLAIVERIAVEHGGAVRAEPVSPRGTRFVLRFPRARRS
jgi:nitrogen fixation/metabolism regulation signal transduction histidine kinase